MAPRRPNRTPRGFPRGLGRAKCITNCRVSKSSACSPLRLEEHQRRTQWHPRSPKTPRRGSKRVTRCPKSTPKWLNPGLQNRPRELQDIPRETQVGPKTVPRYPQDYFQGGHTAQERPKTAPNSRKTAAESPKRHPRRPGRAPKVLQSSPKTVVYSGPLWPPSRPDNRAKYIDDRQDMFVISKSEAVGGPHTLYANRDQ